MTTTTDNAKSCARTDTSQDSQLWLPPGVIVDIDGTMALRGQRNAYDMTGVLEDAPNPAVIMTVQALFQAGLSIIYCSGRSEDARADTVQWLETHTRHPYEALFMRPTGDNIPDEYLKYGIYREHIAPCYDILLVIDDRDKVVRMWREDLELACFQVAYGNF